MKSYYLLALASTIFCSIQLQAQDWPVKSIAKSRAEVYENNAMLEVEQRSLNILENMYNTFDYQEIDELEGLITEAMVVSKSITGFYKIVDNLAKAYEHSGKFEEAKLLRLKLAEQYNLTDPSDFELLDFLKGQLRNSKLLCTDYLFLGETDQGTEIFNKLMTRTYDSDRDSFETRKFLIEKAYEAGEYELVIRGMDCFQQKFSPFELDEGPFQDVLIDVYQNLLRLKIESIKHLNPELTELGKIDSTAQVAMYFVQHTINYNYHKSEIAKALMLWGDIFYKLNDSRSDTIYSLIRSYWSPLVENYRYMQPEYNGYNTLRLPPKIDVLLKAAEKYSQLEDNLFYQSRNYLGKAIDIYRDLLTTKEFNDPYFRTTAIDSHPLHLIVKQRLANLYLDERWPDDVRRSNRGEALSLLKEAEAGYTNYRIFNVDDHISVLNDLVEFFLDIDRGDLAGRYREKLGLAKQFKSNVLYENDVVQLLKLLKNYRFSYSKTCIDPGSRRNICFEEKLQDIKLPLLYALIHNLNLERKNSAFIDHELDIDEPSRISALLFLMEWNFYKACDAEMSQLYAREVINTLSKSEFTYDADIYTGLAYYFEKFSEYDLAEKLFQKSNELLLADKREEKQIGLQNELGRFRALVKTGKFGKAEKARLQIDTLLLSSFSEPKKEDVLYLIEFQTLKAEAQRYLGDLEVWSHDKLDETVIFPYDQLFSEFKANDHRLGLIYLQIAELEFIFIRELIARQEYEMANSRLAIIMNYVRQHLKYALNTLAWADFRALQSTILTNKLNDGDENVIQQVKAGIRVNDLNMEWSNSTYAHYFGLFHPQYGESLFNIGLWYARVYKLFSFPDNYPYFLSANENLLEAMLMYEENYGENSPQYATVLSEYAGISNHNGIYEPQKYYSKSNDIILNNLSLTFPYLTEKEKSVFYGSLRDHFDTYYGYILNNHWLVPEMKKELYETRIKTKGILFQTQKEIRDRVNSSGDKELKTLFNNWLDQRKYLEKLIDRSLGSYNEEELETAKEELEQIEKKLSIKSLENTSSTEYDYDFISKSLSSKEAAIEIIRYEITNDSTIYMGLIIKNDIEYPELVVLNNGYELDHGAYKNYINRIYYQLEDDESYKKYWEPFVSHLSDIEKVYFSADGIYHKISLSGLYNSDNEKYLLDEIKIIPVLNTKLITKNRRRETTKSAVLIGYPKYDNAQESSTTEDDPFNEFLNHSTLDSTQRFFNGEEIVLLPGTKEEVSSIENIISSVRKKIDVSAIIDSEATEGYIKS
jgi:hypothetical protein